MIGLGASVVLGDVAVGCPIMLGRWPRQSDVTMPSPPRTFWAVSSGIDSGVASPNVDRYVVAGTQLAE
jgi:hypothetical protein